MMEQKSAQKFIEDRKAKGSYSFSTTEYRRALGVSEIAAQNAIRRARERGEVATPYRGFHVIVPPEYRSVGCLPAERFIADLMNHLGEPYYVGLLTAAAYYGAAHHAPQEFQVMVKKPRPDMVAGKVHISFIVRKDLDEMEVGERKTPSGMIRVSTPEQTALDLVGYDHRSGGLDNVATVLAELAESMNSGKLRDIAAKAGPIRWSQRLGYLLQFVGAKSKAHGIAHFIEEASPRATKLDPRQPAVGKRDNPWRVIVNTDVEPDI